MKNVVIGQKERVGAWVAEKVGRRANSWGEFEAIGLSDDDGRLIAGMVVEGYVKDARCLVHLAGEGKRWLNREYLGICCRYMFDQLRCKVVIGLVDADNEAALRFDKHFGFSEVGRVPYGGGDCDLVILAMTRDQCRWLEVKARQS